MITEPNTPLNNADHVGSFLFYGGIYGFKTSSKSHNILYKWRTILQWYACDKKIFLEMLLRIKCLLESNVD